MRVLFVTRKYPPAVGGMQRLSYQLITLMEQRAHVQAVTWGGSQKALPFFLPYALVRSMLACARGVDLVHLGDPVLAAIGCLAKCVYRVPVVVSAHGLDITFPLPVYKQLVLRSLRCADRVVCISRETLRACLDRGIPADRCLIIRPGVQRPAIVPSREGARAWLEGRLNRSLQDVSVLLTVGRLVPRKGIAWFVESVLPRLLTGGAKVCYVVVGTGPEEDRVRALIRALNLEGTVGLLGQVSEHDLSVVYVAADLFVMPNLRRQGDMEGFGMVALEAAAHGLPVLAADLEGIRDAVTVGRTGSLLQTGNAELWAESVLELLRRPDQLRAIAESASATVEESFTWTRMLDEYEALFRQVIQQHQQTSGAGSPRVP